MSPRLPALTAYCRSAPTLVTPVASFLAPLIQSRNASILSNLSDNPGAYNKRIRRGRGPSSGKGKTSGRGHKGQKQHGKVPARFQGGQTPQDIVQGVRGFENHFSVDMSPINLNRIQEWIDQGRLDPTRPITLKELADSRCLHGVKDGVKLLARGKEELKTPINILVSRASATAIEAVEAIGGTVTTRFYTKPAIKRLLAAASAASPFSYRLPDPTSRKDIEYYRDPAHRGYLSHQVEEGQGPSLFFRAPRTGNFQKKSKKAGTAAAARDNRICVDTMLFDQRPAKLNLKGNIWRPSNSGSLQIQPYARLHEYEQVTRYVQAFPRLEQKLPSLQASKILKTITSDNDVTIQNYSTLTYCTYLYIPENRRDIMSLFGEIDEPAAARNPTKSRLSLFDDEPSSIPGSKSSLFADDDDISGGSPWNTSVPKKLAREDLLKTLLPTSDVPESYIDIFDDMIKDGKGSNGKLSADDVESLLFTAGLNSDKISWILTIIIPSGGEPRDLERNEVNVLLALIGLAQEEEDIQDITLDGVDERRRNLPVPHFITSDPTTASPPSNFGPSISDEVPVKLPQRPLTPPSDSLEFPESDPWGSPALHKGHNHASPRSNGAPTNGTREPVRTTSNFTTSSADGSNGSRHQQSIIAPAEPAIGGWGSYDTNPNFNNSATPPVGESGGFGGDGGEGERSEEPAPQARTFGGGRVTGNGVEENIVVTLLAEKEGMFLFQHHNYQVTSVRRGSKVVRRYSDFVWLLDCLQKRFPFRQIPLLPPKRVAAAESSFMEKRRRGLARFSNALVRHPVLSQEQLVIMFLTVPTELAVRRKQATISIQEEFVGRPLHQTGRLFTTYFERSLRSDAKWYPKICRCMRPSWDQGVLEDLKRQRDSLVSMRDMFDRRDRYDKDNIPYLERRFRTMRIKLVTIRAKPEHLVKPGEIERVTEAIIKDKESISTEPRLAQERVKYSELQADNWKQLQEELENSQATGWKLDAACDSFFQANGNSSTQVKEIESLTKLFESYRTFSDEVDTASLKGGRNLVLIPTKSKVIHRESLKLIVG
ncbi:hypothetical protein DID88_001423 [Monilinia fructigena]|uniref:Sorting nexin MVP1 n=1 Tax=Monilinia fructigena TaxID=38457 RepID=A0A395IX03_9HELO|nr:hypothetical protein DID88_001423 [Monilinia fructigena]